MKKFYYLKKPKSKWGDYSSILISGMGCHSPRRDGLIQLERTGPYIPPISFPRPDSAIVTEMFRQQIESSGLTGFRFQPVIKKHIAHLDWRAWDLSAEKPQHYPEGGEPEGYILNYPHSSETSAKMGNLWELMADEGATADKQEELKLIAASWQGADFFGVAGGWRVCISEKAKSWLEQQAAEHIRFIEIPVK